MAQPGARTFKIRINLQSNTIRQIDKRAASDIHQISFAALFI